MEQLSGLEGVEAPGPSGGTSGGQHVDLDPSSFLRELQKVLGGKARRSAAAPGAGGAPSGADGAWDGDDGEGSTSDEEGSSFFSDDDDNDDDEDTAAEGEEGDDEENAAALHAKNVQWEVNTETDSDDDEAASQESDDVDGSDEDGADATAQLLAVLGVDDGADGAAAALAQMAQQAQRQAGATRPAKCGGELQKAGREGAPSGLGGAARAPSSEAGRKRRDGGRSTRGGDGFLQLYDAAMQAELAGTTLTRTFESVPAALEQAAASASGKGESREATGDDGSLQPVDLDMNLVRNLLRSYTAQQGSAGPVGNIAGMLGLSLPAGDVEG
ncbi:hypothetical protein GPECTOR_40g597 [Gonium pectorale]|uniref:Uncharacterized protein n=1 Tax=Gonium pectorale TaxID=33097 RepID=A0A150GAS3_GONPE|nr:hypothetical protein GPECTOR_40g597 [Gonium pectorale]|eukprot:KXZ46863.1 hypothetical protein GPECTOR_40g597 [Gonium pectorale]